jgi:hypothetical protein
MHSDIKGPLPIYTPQRAPKPMETRFTLCAYMLTGSWRRTRPNCTVVTRTPAYVFLVPRPAQLARILCWWQYSHIAIPNRATARSSVLTLLQHPQPWFVQPFCCCCCVCQYILATNACMMADDRRRRISGALTSPSRPPIWPSYRP